MIKRNAVIMAAGTSSRFVPLSFEKPKALLDVKGEILIERQIRQLQEAGINEITIVVGYKAEQFHYLKDKYNLELVYNEDYYRYNNTSSVIRVLDKLSDTYICSSDNYFPSNVFLEDPYQSYYSCLYADGKTGEYCLSIDDQNNIVEVRVGGHNSWYMVGHVYFSKDFSTAFKKILTDEYSNEVTKKRYWEDVYIKHLSSLPNMKAHRYNKGEILEFDSLDELRSFDATYIGNTRSKVLKLIASKFNCSEASLHGFKNRPHSDKELIFSFMKDDDEYLYNECNGTITKI